MGSTTVKRGTFAYQFLPLERGPGMPIETTLVTAGDTSRSTSAGGYMGLPVADAELILGALQHGDARADAARRAMTFLANNCTTPAAAKLVDDLMRAFSFSAADLYEGGTPPRSHSADLR